MSHYLIKHYGFAIKEEEINQAKTILYQVRAKMLESKSGRKPYDRVRKLRNPFLEKGTLREARLFFKYEVNFTLFFHDFSNMVDFVIKDSTYIDKQGLKISFPKLMPCLLMESDFYALLKRSISEEGVIYPEFVHIAFHEIDQ